MHIIDKQLIHIQAMSETAGDTLAIRGSWPLAATRVKLDIAPYTDPSRKVLQTELAAGGKEWTKSIPLRFPLGLYQGTLKAFQGERKLSETEFTFVVAPEEIGGRHPRIRVSPRGRLGTGTHLDHGGDVQRSSESL